MNMSSFVLGMLAGLLYCKHKQGDIDLTKSKVHESLILHIWWTLSFNELFSFLSNRFYQYFGTVYCQSHSLDFTPVIFSMRMISRSQQCGSRFMQLVWKVCGVYLVRLWSLDLLWIQDVSEIAIFYFSDFLAVINNNKMMLDFCAFNFAGVFKNILRMQMFRTMGRLTFGAYLIHPSVIRFLYGSMRHPSYTDDFRVVKTYTKCDSNVYSLAFYTILILICLF